MRLHDALDPVRGALVRDARRIVVKLGTNVVLDADGAPAAARLERLVDSLAALRAAGREVLLVTSGAVGLGASRLGTTAALTRQAQAAVGQGRLLAFYHQAFARRGVEIAQVLLTDADFDAGARERRLAATLDSLLSHGVLPVINENDVVGDVFGAPLRASAFRDNDMLASVVARTTHASLLLLLSDVDGVYTANPARSPDATLIPTIRRLTPALLLGTAGRGARGRGGMSSKLRAAARASAAGIGVVIANGHADGVIERILGGEAVGTLLAREAR
jgi:glutamate 5-kinase